MRITPMPTPSASYYIQDGEFLDSYKDIAVGQKVRIIVRCPKRYRHMTFAPVHSDFLDFIRAHGNEFTVETIQRYDHSSAMVTLEEVPNRALEYEQVEPIGKRRSKVFNWHRRVP